MNKLNKIIRVIKEYPLSAILCMAADIVLTARYSEMSLQTEAIPAVYIVALYGTIAAILIFCFGLVYAQNKAAGKEAERRRNARRRAMASMYRKEYYEQLSKM